ncbi:MAG: hypothetical protein M3439_11985 [Chloroflexota bacterium]|nr:hypothetical protein [Chloroflexota bacterium]
MSARTTEEILAWMQAHPRDDGYPLVDLASQFGLSPERMRDRLLRLVNTGQLAQSEPVTGFADSNPSYMVKNSGG